MTKPPLSLVPHGTDMARSRARHPPTALLVLPIVLTALVACASPPPKAKPSPASVYCQKQGGQIVVEGSVGICHLPDGRMIEEWEYLRANIP